MYLRIKHDEYSLTSGALEVNKINIVEHHAQAKYAAEAGTILRTFLNGAVKTTGKKRLIPAGHNVVFDMQFLRAHLLDDATWNEYFTYPAFDTAAIARYLNAVNVIPGGYSLTALRNAFLPELSTATMHNAETDNLVTLALAKKFVSLWSTQTK